MPKKPTLSPSKITTYLACPVKYKWTYIDDRGKWYFRSRSYYSFGTSLHSVLQRFHSEGDIGVQTTEQAVAALEESWIKAGYSSQDEMMQALSEGKAIVEKYVEAVTSMPVTSKTILVEKQFRTDLGEFVLLGRLDRVDELEDGTLEIIDYKSGRGTVSEDHVKGDIAMECYQILMRSHYPGRRVIASIIALRTNEKGTYGMTDEEAEELKATLVSLGTEILNTDYDSLEPIGKELCHRCDFLPLCKKHPHFVLPPIEQE